MPVGRPSKHGRVTDAPSIYSQEYSAQFFAQYPPSLPSAHLFIPSCRDQDSQQRDTEESEAGGVPPTPYHLDLHA